MRTKKSFIRYISHELRTPLNSAVLGLRLHVDDMKDNDLLDDQSRLETVNDVEAALSTAIDILDSLMIVDEGQRGMLVLAKEEVCVLPF